MLDRCYQSALVVGAIGFSWFAMMDVHELGHVVAAWLTGGEVRRVVLPVVGFSRTDLNANPHPLLVAWGGAVLGSLFPLMLLAIARMLSRRGTFVLSFFAGFCLISNGAYLAGGAWINAGDAGDLLAQGTRHWQLIAFGLPAVALGLRLWNGLGPHFGLRMPAGKVDRSIAIAAFVACVLIIAFNALVSSKP